MRSNRGDVVAGVWPVDDHSDAFEAFVREHHAELVRLAMLVAAGSACGEDAVQDALVAVAPRWAQVAEGSQLAYVRTAVVRRAVKPRTRRARELLAPVWELAETPVEQLLDGEDRRLVAALAQLGSRQRAVVVLRPCYDLDVRRVADLLGCSEGTVRSQALRGLARLRELLPDWDEED